jgi:hypothetical protein
MPRLKVVIELAPCEITAPLPIADRLNVAKFMPPLTPKFDFCANAVAHMKARQNVNKVFFIMICFKLSAKDINCSVNIEMSTK